MKTIIKLTDGTVFVTNTPLTALLALINAAIKKSEFIIINDIGGGFPRHVQSTHITWLREDDNG